MMVMTIVAAIAAADDDESEGKVCRQMGPQRHAVDTDLHMHSRVQSCWRDAGADADADGLLLLVFFAGLARCRKEKDVCTHIHAHTHIYIYIYIHMYVCMQTSIRRAEIVSPHIQSSATAAGAAAVVVVVVVVVVRTSRCGHQHTRTQGFFFKLEILAL